MIRNFFKSISGNRKFDNLIKKYKIPKEYLAVNRRLVTKALLIGLFWGFIPMPMQMLAVLSTTPFVKFNVPIAFSMVWLSNPLTMPLMYYMEYKTGVILLGGSEMENINLSLEWFQSHWSEIVMPLYIGTIPYSVGVSLLIYFLANKLWICSVKKKRRTLSIKKRRHS